MNKSLIKIFTTALVVLGVISCSNMNEWKPDFASNNAKVLQSETFEKNLGKYTAISVSGDQTWQQTRDYAIMTGYQSETKTNIANEDWLISPSIDLSEESAANVSFLYVARYFNDLKSQFTIWVSDNYNGGMPNTATWEELKPEDPFMDMGSWTFTSSREISLTKYAGKKINFAIKYISTAEKAGTLEIKNIVIKNTEAFNIKVDNGKGTRENPYNVMGAKANKGKSAWISAYIVGYIDTNSDPFTTVLKGENSNQTTNIILADSTNNLYINNTMPVQLPSGAVRNALNLKENSKNFGQKILIYGDITSYFGATGLKGAAYFELADGTKGGTEPIDYSKAIFYESFGKGFGKFTTYSVSGDEKWTYKSKYKCAYMSGYVNRENHANEDWMISPDIDLAGANNAILTFDHALRFNQNPSTDATIWVSEDYKAGAPNTATWVQLPTNLKDGTSWSFVNAGQFSLAKFANKKIKIAFKYVATDVKAGTWEVKNVVVK